MSDVAGHDKGQVSEVDFVALQPGQKVGRYEIVAVLGQGGFGITYRARDSQLNREVAIKEYLLSALAARQDGVAVLPRSTKMSEDFTWGRQRFVAEGRTLATLQHAPAIVRVFDFLEANGTAYIIMELVPGSTLEDRLKGGKTLAPWEVDKILWPLLDRLEQVHATGFLHRDIKPANILLDTAGNPTLIDFGASRAGGGGSNNGDDSDLHAGLCGGGAIHFRQAGSVDGHLRRVGHDLPHDHGGAAAERLRSHARGRLSAPGQIDAGRIRARTADRYRCRP